VAVDDLSFTLPPGTITGFLGPSGAGKTTTVRMLLGLAAPASGHSLVLGRPYAELEPTVVRVRRANRPDLQPRARRGGADRDTTRDDQTLRVHGAASERVGEIAFAAGGPLHELATEGSSLEEIFLELTSEASS
jgi:energy-coupling factor transporter ATP-binding protein EcfA2